MQDMSAQIPLLGAGCIGAVVGWMAHRAFEQASEIDARWIGAMLAVLGGGAVAAYLQRSGTLFGAYGIGLASTFFIRLLTFSPWAVAINGRVLKWLRPSRAARAVVRK